MKTVFKWLGYIFLGLMISVVIGISIIQLYKKEILATVNEKLRESVNGDVSIGDYQINLFHNFPNISITLKDIYLHGPAYNIYYEPFLKAERVDVNVEPLKLFRKKITINSVDIQNGRIFIFRTQTGYTNTEVLRRGEMNAATETAGNNQPLELKKINLLNVSFTYQDSLKQKQVGVHFIRTVNSVIADDSLVQLQLAGQMKFDELLLNAQKGSLLKNKTVIADLKIDLKPSAGNLTLLPSTLAFDKSLVKLSGMFQLGAPGEFALEILSDKLDYAEGLSLLPDTLAAKLTNYRVEKPVGLRVTVKGLLGPGVKPAVDVRFSFNKSEVTAGKIHMENMSMAGMFTNHVSDTAAYDDRNSQIHFSSIDGLLDNMPVKAVATLTNLKDPGLDLKATFDIDLKDLNEHLDTTKIRLLNGKFISVFTYNGKLTEYLDETKTRYEGRLSGNAKITNGQIQYLPRKITVDNVNADFHFTEEQFNIKNLALSQNKNRISFNGYITDFIPFFTNPATTGKVNLSILSPAIDLSGLLQPRRAVKTQRAKAVSKKKIADLIERLNEKLEFHLDFNIGSFRNKNFKASKLTGRLTLADNRFILRDSRMEFAKGNVQLNLRVSNLQKPINPISIQATLRDVSISDFFHSFNNFNQTTFRHDHVEGKLNLIVNMSAEINDRLDVLTPHLKGDVRFTIREGRLRDFEPMQRLSNFLFKGRDFSDVQFGEIASVFKIDGTKIDLHRMEVESTVLTMFIEGRYDLKDSSDLSIQVPLSNLKKRDQNFAPENIGTDARTGASVFLRVRPDKTGKNTISYDPFKKMRKKKSAPDAP